MYTGKTTDNNGSKRIEEVFKNQEITAELRERLKRFSDVNISQLIEGNKGLLIYPPKLDEHKDGIGKASLFSLHGNDEIETGNILGFIGFQDPSGDPAHDARLDITSRFDKGRNNFFLHYILQKVLALNIFDLKAGTSEEEVWDFLYYLFPLYLKRALCQGEFREYQHRVFNDSNVRGTIDVARHLRLNVPFAGKIAYRTREYLHDNRMTQLIRHTIEFIKTKEHARGILSADQDIKKTVEKIIAATPTYAKSQRVQVIGKNLRNVSHPYYTEYLPLQKLCLHILRHEKLSYGDDDDVIYGILFDGAWLWEEYLNTVLETGNFPGFKHPRNISREGGVRFFKRVEYGTNHICYPDFYCDSLVADAKYRWSDKVASDDLSRLVAYLYLINRKKGCFIYPASGRTPAVQSENARNNRAKKMSNKGELNGIGGFVFEYFMEIPVEAQNFVDFCNKMKVQEKYLVDAFDELCRRQVN